MANLNSRSYPKGLREIRYPSNDVIHRFTSKDYTGEIRLDNETGEFVFNPELNGGGSSAGTTFTVAQLLHGFNVGQPIYHNGSAFALADASAVESLGIWVVTAVTSLDTFTAAQSGRFEMIDHGLAPGEFYFVNTVAGGLTPVEPLEYSNPIIYVESVDIVHVLPYRPSSTSGTGGGGGTGNVSSVFGRAGAVVAENGDYTKDQVGLNNVDNVQQIPLSLKGAVNGVADLDGGGKVPLDQLPTSIQGGINIIGFWDADTNTPNIGALTLMDGQAYQVSVAGSTTLNGITSWGVFDLAVWDNALIGNWFKISSAGQVTSVNAKTGDVVLDTGDIAEGSNEYYTEAKVSSNSDVVINSSKVSADGSIGTHSDVDVTTIVPAAGQPLIFDGTNWIPANVSGIGDMLSSVYDPNIIVADSFDYNNFINTPTITNTLAGNGVYYDVDNVTLHTGTETGQLTPNTISYVVGNDADNTGRLVIGDKYVYTATLAEDPLNAGKFVRSGTTANSLGPSNHSRIYTSRDDDNTGNIGREAAVENLVTGDTYSSTIVVRNNLAGTSTETLASIAVTKSGITPATIMVDGETGFEGIQYTSDYDANFTDDSLVSKRYVDNNGGGGAAETIITAPTSWDGTTYPVNLETPTIFKRVVNDLVTTLTFDLNFPIDAATASREIIVEVDNSTNTSPISVLTFIGNWKWGVGVEPLGIAAGAKVQLYLYNTSATEIKSSWEVDA